MAKDNVVKIFTIEQQFPCGPKSSCCGPVGQSEKEMTSLKNAIGELGLDIEIYNIQKIKNLQEYPQIFKLFRSFGPKATPIVTVNDEIACMGQSEKSNVISAIKEKL